MLPRFADSRLACFAESIAFVARLVDIDRDESVDMIGGAESRDGARRG